MFLNGLTAEELEKLTVFDLGQMPGQMPPPGHVSNLVDPPNLITQAAVTLSISWLSVIVAIGLRIYSKISTGKPFTADDCEYSLTKEKGAILISFHRYQCSGNGMRAQPCLVVQTCI
jgi:hypothetical protein